MSFGAIHAQFAHRFLASAGQLETLHPDAFLLNQLDLAAALERAHCVQFADQLRLHLDDPQADLISPISCLSGRHRWPARILQAGCGGFDIEVELARYTTGVLFVGFIERLHAIDDRLADRWPGPDRTARLLRDEPESIQSSWAELTRQERESYWTATDRGDNTTVPPPYRMALLRADESRLFRLMRVTGYVLVALLVPALVMMATGQPGVSAAFALPGLALAAGQPFVWLARLRKLRRRRREVTT